jgi:hypothetical protein
MCGSVRYHDAEFAVSAICRSVTSELHRATSPELEGRNDQEHSIFAVRAHGVPKSRCQRIPGTFSLLFIFYHFITLLLKLQVYSRF